MIFKLEFVVRIYIRLALAVIFGLYAENSSAQGIKLSVKDFGAIGDGIVTDTVAVQRALDFLTLKGGGVLYFPTGRYKALVAVSNNNITLKGDGYVSEIFWPVPVDGAVLTFESPRPKIYKEGDVFSKLNNVGVEKMKITGVNYGKLTNGLGFSNCNKCFVQDVWIDNVNWKGLTFQNGSENIIVDNILITNAALSGLTLEHSGENAVLNNIRVRHVGFQQDVPNYSRSGCVEILQLTSGWVPEAAWKKISMSNVDVEDCVGDGVVIDIKSNFVASEFSLKNIIINNIGKSGIYISGGVKGNLFSLIVDGVKINGVDKNGMDIKYLTDYKLSNIEVSDFKEHGIITEKSDCVRDLALTKNKLPIFLGKNVRQGPC